MKFYQTYRIRSYEMGLLFRRDEFIGVLQPGRHRFVDLFGTIRVDVVSRRDPWLQHERLDLIVKSGALAGYAEVVDLDDHQRALVWIDQRFQQILSPGLHVYWTGFKQVQVEVVDARNGRFDHRDFKVIARNALATKFLETCVVERYAVGVLFVDGRFVEVLPPGQYGFWKGHVDARIVAVDQREVALDVSGQELMTADKVSLRLNATVNYQISDAQRAVCQTEDVRQAVYREAQLILRAIVGARELDAFLVDKDSVALEIENGLRQRAMAFGLHIASVGIRDVILPGEMKELMNKVTEAKKAAEANLIFRREETAAMRSQANTAKLLADNPMLMRLREWEVLEKIATAGHLQVLIGDKSNGEKGLADKVINLL